MFIIIVGCSETGFGLARLLLVSGHEVAVVERSQARCQLLWTELGSVAVLGDGVDPEDLKRAGINRADVVVALTGQDDTNLVVCQLAKHQFHIDRTAAVIKDAKNQPIFRLLGVDLIVNSPDLILDSLEQGIAEVNLRRRLTLRIPNTSIVSIAVPHDAAAIGRLLTDVGHNPQVDTEILNHSFVCMVIRGRQTLPPTGLTVAENDELFAVTTADEEPKLYELFTGVKP